MSVYTVENWKSQLLQEVDADELPVHWGGTATDPDGDPCCRSRVDMSCSHIASLTSDSHCTTVLLAMTRQMWCQLSLAIPPWLSVPACDSWGINRRTTRCTSRISTVWQCELGSGWGLRRQRSAPCYGPRASGRTYVKPNGQSMRSLIDLLPGTVLPCHFHHKN